MILIFYILKLNKLSLIYLWYIIIILTLVYWSLYKIIKDYSWSYFNKAFSLLNSTFFLNWFSIKLFNEEKY